LIGVAAMLAENAARQIRFLTAALSGGNLYESPPHTVLVDSAKELSVNMPRSKSSIRNPASASFLEISNVFWLRPLVPIEKTSAYQCLPIKLSIHYFGGLS